MTRSCATTLLPFSGLDTLQGELSHQTRQRRPLLQHNLFLSFIILRVRVVVQVALGDGLCVLPVFLLHHLISDNIKSEIDNKPARPGGCRGELIGSFQCIDPPGELNWDRTALSSF